MMQPNQPCALCRVPSGEWGNNPDPLGDVDQRVCDECNARFVIPARVGMFSPAQIDALRILITSTSRALADTAPEG